MADTSDRPEFHLHTGSLDKAIVEKLAPAAVAGDPVAASALALTSIAHTLREIAFGDAWELGDYMKLLADMNLNYRPGVRK